MFSKIVLNGCLFTTSQKLNKRSCNFFAQLKSGTFVKVLHFLVNTNSKDELIICQKLLFNDNPFSKTIKEIHKLEPPICIQTSLISKPCIVIEIEGKMYIIPVPNTYIY